MIWGPRVRLGVDLAPSAAAVIAKYNKKYKNRDSDYPFLEVSHWTQGKGKEEKWKKMEEK